MSTRVGAWSIIKQSEDFQELAGTHISFTIPISKALDGSHVHFVIGSGSSGCTGGSATTPKADPGNLCVYLGTAPLGLGGTISQALTLISNPATGATGASKEGALVFLNGSAGIYNGTWAVTDE